MKMSLTDIPARSAESHKGDYGHVLIMGGAPGMSGSVLLAGEAALRAGAGRVTIVTHPSHASFLNINRPELMVYGVRYAHELHEHLNKATHLVLGPGLSTQGSWAEMIYETAIVSHKPMVLDADGLNQLAHHPLPLRNAILTPHPGEAARLLKTSVEVIQAHRRKSILALQLQYGGVIVLKGHSTLVCNPVGEIWECEAGNPGMATAGMGDVLSGLLAGLWAQVHNAEQAACLGVNVHATAGDLAAQQGARGMVASDLFPYIRQLLR